MEHAAVAEQLWACRLEVERKTYFRVDSGDVVGGALLNQRLLVGEGGLLALTDLALLDVVSCLQELKGNLIDVLAIT